MFYINYVRLCNKANKSPSAAAEEMGFQRSVVTRWSKGTTPRAATLQKIADYFGVPASELLDEKEKAPTQMGERILSDDDIKFALFGGDGDITDAMFDEVKRFARMVKLREEAEKKKE